VPSESERAPGSGDYLSFFPLSTYRERLDSLIDGVWQGVGHQAPDALEKMAATARSIAERLDEMAVDARQRMEEMEETERTRKAAGTEDPGPEPDAT
jgi:hypothetical protein